MYASLTASTGGDPILSALLYPIGFVYIILGRYQLYTENTLPPVALVLERLASFAHKERTKRMLSIREWLFGGLVGRSYVSSRDEDYPRSGDD